MSCVITGGSSGIGLACAKTLGRTNNLILVGRDPEKIAAARAQLPPAPDWHLWVAGDVCDPKTAARAVDKGLELDSIDTLICCAGYGRSTATEMAEFAEDWAPIIDANLNGAFHFVRACLPGMLERSRGTIVLVSSTAGLIGTKRNAAYTAAKHALVGFAKSLAVEHGKRGIVAVPVCPGFVDTPMTDKVVAGLVRHRGIDEKEAREVLAAQSPQNRIIPVEEVAEAIAFVVSGKCKSLSGHELVLNGGGL